MRQILVGFLMAALAVLPLQADDKPDVKQADSEVSFKSLKQEYEQGQKQLRDLARQYQQAKTDEERQEIEKKFRGLQTKFSQGFLSYAKTHPKNADAFDALMMGLKMTGGPQADKKAWAQAMGLLKTDWAKKPEIKQVVRMVAGLDDNASEELIRRVAEENSDHQTQAAAYKALLQRSKSVADLATRLKDNAELRERVEKQLGKDFVQQRLAKGDKAKEESEKLDKLLKEKYGDVVLDLSIGKKAPEVVSEDLDGKKVRLSDLRGKVVMLDIWATWCGPCKAMIPHERKMVERLKDKPFVLVSVSGDDDKETLKSFLKETKMPWTHWWSGAGGIIADWDITAFPTIYLLDAKGVIRHKFVGSPGNEKLDNVIDKLVEETDKKETK